MAEHANVTEMPVAATTTPTLVLHQFPRSSVAPSLSPFALKLETYLRMAGLGYQNDFNKPTSSKGKCPWITYNNNQDVADSSMCIDFLKNVTNTDLNAHLSPPEKAISRAFQKMAEEELAWVLALWRWNYDKDENIVKELGSGKIKSFFILKVIRRNTKGSAHGHGIGRHSQEEVMKIGTDDIKALGDFLGPKTYFMGETVSEVDCTIFALLAEMLYTAQTCPLTVFIKEHYQNLASYCDRMRAQYWPDWEEIGQSVTLEKEKKKLNKSMSVAPTNAAETKEAVVTENGHHHQNGDVAGVVTVTESIKQVTLENGQSGVVHVVEETVKNFPLTNGGGDIGLIKENGHHVEAMAAPAV